MEAALTIIRNRYIGILVTHTLTEISPAPLDVYLFSDNEGLKSGCESLFVELQQALTIGPSCLMPREVAA